MHTPPVGYLAASSNRNDSDCVNRPHLEAVLAARRLREKVPVDIGVEVAVDTSLFARTYDAVVATWASFPRWLIRLIIGIVAAHLIVGGWIACR